MSPTNSFRAGAVGLPLPSAVVSQLTQIYEFRGKQALYETRTPDILDALRRRAIIESTESSNRIEGVVASPSRVRELVGLNAEPRNRSEAEIAGYRDVLSTIHASFPHIKITPNYILQLHRDLFKYAGGRAGAWKSADNLIQATLPDGTKETIFVPVSALLTPIAIDTLTRDFEEARNTQRADPLILIAALALDFLCLHPFTDGNGRMARLLSSLLLYQAGFAIPRYVSLERLIERTEGSYYASLRTSSEAWHEGRHSLQPWLEYFLGIVLAAYRDLETDVKSASELTKVDRVRAAVADLPQVFSIRELETACPGVSRQTIRIALAGLRREHRIQLLHGGRYAKWRKLPDNRPSEGAKFG